MTPNTPPPAPVEQPVGLPCRLHARVDSAVTKSATKLWRAGDMILTAAAALVGLFAGSLITDQLWRWLGRSERDLIEAQQSYVDSTHRALEHAWGILTNLRANAFVTNERGHRVRYVNASPAEQARAEQP